MKLSAPVFLLKRKARQLSRDSGIPLHQALDQIANGEGFSHWSSLAAKIRPTLKPVSKSIYTNLQPGQLILVAARPGHGKTTLGMQMLVSATSKGHRGIFFTLVYTEAQALEQLQKITNEFNANPNPAKLEVDSSDDISAPYIIERLQTASAGTVIVIDYLQLLDQKRTNPDLTQQVVALKQFAMKKKICIILISQVDRSFELSTRQFPTLADVRLPNPLDLALIDQAYFLNNRQIVCETAE